MVIGLADIFGVAPVKSFWSNFERMEGFIMLLHLGMFFLVTSSVFKEIDWKRWWNTSLAASFMMVLYCVLQIIGLKTINQGGVRVDGTLGNAIYLAVYMLFHIFIALLFLWRTWKSVALRWVYGLLIVLQVWVLYMTATRGAILGLIGGALVVILLNLINKENALIRKASVAGLLGVVVLVGGFMVFRNSEFVTNSPVLSRFSSLSVENIKTQGRYFVWPMALEGVKDRPILGWGQENFNYIFQEHYKAEMFRLEPWFDRVHNIFLDWAVAGGLLGLLAYLSLYFALLFIVWKRGQFSYTEKSILTGLVAAYFFHNFFVFDHLVSYVLFFSLLVYVHYRNAGEPLWGKSFAEAKINRIVLPIVTIVLLASLYFVNIEPIKTNVFLIKALKAVQTPGETARAVEYFRKAYDTSRLGRPEVVEHIASNSAAVVTGDLSMEEKNAFFDFAKNAVLKQINDSGNDARYELLGGGFLSAFGFSSEALPHLERAKALMSGKQQIYFEIGSVYVNEKEPLRALETFREAYELAPENLEAKVIYLIGAIYAGDRKIEQEIIGSMLEGEFVFDDRILNAYYANGRMAETRILLERRKVLDPANAETYQQYLEQLQNN